jgi:prolyl-tRNA editing enzyme YbaK/EbsC (Cys-tRNA(Pro) deacylase)
MTKAEKEINDQHQSQAPGAQAPDETGRDKRSIAKALLGRYPLLPREQACALARVRAVLSVSVRVMVVRVLNLLVWPVAGH